MNAAVGGAPPDDPQNLQQRARRDLGVAVVLALVMVVLLVNAQTIPDSPYEPMGPRFLADVVPGLILVLAVLLAARSLRVILAKGRDQTAADAPRGLPDRRWLRPFGVLLLLLGYGGLLQIHVPYMPATMSFICAAAAILSRSLCVRETAKICITGVIVAVTVNLVFADVLSILLP